MKSGIVYDSIFSKHDTGIHHPENDNRASYIFNQIKNEKFFNSIVKIPIQPCDPRFLEFVHHPAYLKLAKLEIENGLNKLSTGDTAICKDSWTVASLASGGILNAIKQVSEHKIKNAFCITRPPGHHANEKKGMGFCIFNHVAIGARYAQKVLGYEKILIVDWDVHHGNGTQAAFYEDNSALTISIHQDRNFPTNSGLVSENGEAKGDGFNINIPLPPGSGVGAYEAAFDRVVIPALETYQPELIIVPSGFDGGAGDPIGRQMMTSEGFKSLTQKIKKCADEVCDGKILMTHEGGYSAATVPFFAHAVIETLADENMGIQDPFQRIIGNLGQQELQPHQDSLIKEAESLIKKIK